MFCKKCGKELPADAKFCIECGTAVTNTSSDFSSRDKSKIYSSKNKSRISVKQKILKKEREHIVKTVIMYSSYLFISLLVCLAVIVTGFWAVKYYMLDSAVSKKMDKHGEIVKISFLEYCFEQVPDEIQKIKIFSNKNNEFQKKHESVDFEETTTVRETSKAPDWNLIAKATVSIRFYELYPRELTIENLSVSSINRVSNGTKITGDFATSLYGTPRNHFSYSFVITDSGNAVFDYLSPY